MAVTGKALKLPRLAKTLRALKMSKLMKFYQVDELLGQVQINFHISPAFINLLALVFAALVINHFFACVWYMIGLRKFDDDCADGDGNRGRRHCTWMQTGGYSPRDGNWYLYTTCLYWSLSTVSTSIGRLMQSHSSTATTSTIALRDYLYKRNVPMDLCTKIFDYLYRHNAIRAYNNDNSQEVVASINDLPKPIRRRLRLYTERATIGAIPWFQHRSSDFAADAVGFLKPTLSARGEVVGAQGIRAEALFFVQSGDLAVYPEGTKRHRVSTIGGALDELEEEEAEGIRPLLRFGPGDNFGAPGCFVDAVWKLEIIACSDCEISVFPREHLRRLLDEPEHAHLLPQFEYEAHQTVQAAPFLYAFQDPAHQHGVTRHAGDFRSPLGAARRDGGAAGRDNRAAKTALDVARSDSAVAVANFLRGARARGRAVGAPGADVVNGLIALGDYHEHHWTPEPAKSSEKPMKLPAKQRPRTKSKLKQRRKQARHFVRVTMRNGLTKVLKSATKTLRLGWYVRNSRRSKHRWERPFYFDASRGRANAAGFKERVVGPSFVRGGQAFCLELYPGGFREDSRQHVGAYLRYQGAQNDLKHRGSASTAPCASADIMYVGERESVDNQIVRMASADAEGFGEAGGAGDAACLGSGVHRRDYDAPSSSSRRAPARPPRGDQEPPVDVDESRVTAFDDQGDEPSSSTSSAAATAEQRRFSSTRALTTARCFSSNDVAADTRSSVPA
ncbi:phosphorelay sensor kinase [Aureococcus anophagefferens]|nr:phosphorelay sensor kinase [Aureococcus anophagefferens]